MIFQNTRVFAESREVYAAFVAPERLACWWGPAGFRNEFEGLPSRAWRRLALRDGGARMARYPQRVAHRRRDARRAGSACGTQNAPPLHAGDRLSPGMAAPW